MVTRMTGGTFFCTPNDLIYTHLASLSGAATKVYFVLRCHMNQKTDEAFPSYAQIQQLAGIQSASVSKAVKELQAAGLVTVRKQGRRSFYHFTNQSTSESEPVQIVKDTASVSEEEPLQIPKTNHTNRPNEQTKPMWERERARPYTNGHAPQQSRAPTLIEIPDPFIARWIPEFAAEHGLPVKWTEQSALRYVLNYSGTGTRRSIEEWTNKCQKWILEDHERQQRPAARRA